VARRRGRHAFPLAGAIVTGALVVVIVFPLIGLAVRRLLGGGPPFLLGVGTTGLVLYAAMLLHIPPVPVLIVLGLASLWSAGDLARAYRLSGGAFPLVVTIAPIIFLLFTAAVVPLDDYDGRAFWVLKAKAIAHERAIDGPFFDGDQVHNPKNEYPLLIPLAASSVMIATSDIDDMTIRWLYVLGLGSFALYSRRFVGVWPAALIPWIPQFAIAQEGGALSAYNDIFFAAFAGCAFFELVERSSPLRFGIWISFLLLTKNEGLPFALLLLALAVIIWRERVWPALPTFAIASATLWLWRRRVEPTDDDPLWQLLQTLPGKLERFGSAAAGFAKHSLALDQWGVFWIAVLIACTILIARREWRLLLLPVTIIFVMSAVYVTAYTVTNWPIYDHIKVSASRLLMHFAGPALFLISTAGRRGGSG
jgi:hypothetical protein